MISAAQKSSAQSYASTLWITKVLSEETRQRVVNDTLQEFDEEMQMRVATGASLNELQLDRQWIDQEIADRVKKKQPKGFIHIIIMAAISFLIQKMLGWLWDKYTWN